jgi:hypothetical protein
MLLAKGANIDLKTKKGQTALDSSRQKDHADFLGLLARTAPKNNRPATAWNGVSRILMEVSCEERINLSLRSATEFATGAHVWRSVGSRLRLGQLHKPLFYKHKPLIDKHLQTAYTYSMAVAISWAITVPLVKINGAHIMQQRGGKKVAPQASNRKPR